MYDNPSPYDNSPSPYDDTSPYDSYQHPVYAAPASTDPARHRSSAMTQLGEEVGHLWWIPLLAGLISIGFGLAILATDWTVKALVVVTGIAFVVRGVATAFHPSYASDRAGEQIVAGVIGIIVGVVLIAWPAPTLIVLTVVAGGWLAISGTFHVVTSLSRRKHMPHWGLSLAVGVLEVLLGIWIMRRPEATLSLAITVIGLWCVISGVFYCVLAFEVRNAARALARGGDPYAAKEQATAPERSTAATEPSPAASYPTSGATQAQARTTEQQRPPTSSDAH